MNSKNKGKLLDIFSDDDLGLLDVKPIKQKVVEKDRQLIDSFLEINDFYKKNNREPKKEKGIIERKLAVRLLSLKADTIKSEILKEFDEFNLLEIECEQLEEKNIESINDIFEDDILDIFNDTNDDIFTIKNIPKKSMSMPTYVATRVPCKDFDEFEEKLVQCQVDLRNGERNLREFKNSKQIEKDQFFVLNGILLYVAEVGEITYEKGVKNARLRCIFENGTESDMLMRSLSSSLYKDGRRVTEKDKTIQNETINRFNNITNEDAEVGYIYVLKSESLDEKISSIKDLYKIGFSTTTVEERIKRSEYEPTYLMSKVRIITTFKCYNLNITKFENIIHKFFGQSCLDLNIIDKCGNKCRPREWFIVPLNVIEDVIKLIISEQIIYYEYDSKNKKLIYK